MEFSGVLFLDIERIAHKGEDALTFQFDKDGNGYMALFDGCGGAGSQRHPALNNEKSAYLASRCCACYFDYFVKNMHGEENLAIFKNNLFSFLKKINQVYPMEISSVNSELTDVLPTTLSAVLIQNTANQLITNFIWAGDSRGYIIDANGLAQITEDDVDSEDAYDNLVKDAIMNNRIHGNTGKNCFYLHSVKLSLSSKSIILCSSDGCYDYFRNPMLFEYMILLVLYNTNSFYEAKKEMSEILEKVSGDDCSLAIAFYGFFDYSEIKSFVEKRFKKLDQDKDLFNRSYWENQYKRNYYRLNRTRGNSYGRN